MPRQGTVRLELSGGRYTAIFGKHKKQAFEEDLANQQRQTNQLLSQQLTKPPSALEQAQEKEQTDWLQQTSSPDFDITKTTGMYPYLNLFNRSKQNELYDETPLPAAASWGGTSNASLSEALKAQGARQREQEAAGGLEQGFRAKDAAMRGQTLPFLGLQQDRNLSLVNALSGRSANLYGLYGQSIARPSMFQQMLYNFAQGAGQGAGAAAGK